MGWESVEPRLVDVNVQSCERGLPSSLKIFFQAIFQLSWKAVESQSDS